MKKPNVILVITDDQGYGDLGCMGNSQIRTPNIDAFYKESYSFSDFHVYPLCAPTRGAMFTGRRPLRNGVFATCWGRSILHPDETTMAEIFKRNDYATGLFGKWHLGDNYPYRPQDRGFERVVAHKGGGVGQTPDFWANNYFDDTYFHNSMPVKHEGYCTDVWFAEAKNFIADITDKPFFVVISTNAPHHPYLVDKKYSDIYKNNPDNPYPEFNGMITNIDENFGELRHFLKEKDLENNTVLIFMTDNGSGIGFTYDSETQLAVKGYNAGMRGCKGSYYDGGHRVPFIIRYPDGKFDSAYEIREMALGIDILPTLIGLCGLDEGEHLPFDGRSLVPLLQKDMPYFKDDRTEFIQYEQSTQIPEKWENAVITRNWRLINGKELYHVKSDPGQQIDIAAKFPVLVDELKEKHENWWNEVLPAMSVFSPIVLGNDEENPSRLDGLDVMGDVAWNQNMVAAAVKSSGRWNVEFENPGIYRFRLCRWPDELNLPYDATLPADEAADLAPYMPELSPEAVDIKYAELVFFDVYHTKMISSDADQIVFEIKVAKTGKTVLEASFLSTDGQKFGAYYVYVYR